MEQPPYTGSNNDKVQKLSPGWLQLANSKIFECFLCQTKLKKAGTKETSNRQHGTITIKLKCHKNQILLVQSVTKTCS